MKWLARLCVGSLLALTFFNAAAQQQDIHFEAVAEVEVGKDGTSRLIQVFNIDRAAQTEAAQSRLKAEVAARIAAWRFQAAQVNGVPADAHTFVKVKMAAHVLPEGDFEVRVLSAFTGPRAAYRVPAAYPKGALKAGAEGFVILLLDVGSNGLVESIAVENSDTSPGGGATRNSFEAVAKQSVGLWKFQNETVNGEPKAARVRIPMIFCLSDGSTWCQNVRREQRQGPVGEALALNPAVRLLNEVGEHHFPFR